MCNSEIPNKTNINRQVGSYAKIRGTGCGFYYFWKSYCLAIHLI